MTRRPLARAAVVVPFATGLLAAAGVAYGVAVATATGGQAVSVATFGVQAQPSAGPVQQGALVLTYTDNQRDVRYFVLRNTGSLVSTGQSWTVTLTNTGGGTRGDAVLTGCTTPYTSAGTCTGTEAPIRTLTESATAGAPFPTAFRLEPGAAAGIRFSPQSPLKQFTASFHLEMARSQAAAATTSSS